MKKVIVFGKQPFGDLLILHKHNTINNFLKERVELDCPFYNTNI